MRPSTSWPAWADNGGVWEVGNLGVGDDDGVFNVAGEVAEAGAEDDAEAGLPCEAAADVVHGCLLPG